MKVKFGSLPTIITDLFFAFSILSIIRIVAFNIFNIIFVLLMSFSMYLLKFTEFN